ncbi:hypothetical protein GCM10027610_082670 [Dactylosporangium cerinum]
MRCGIGERVDLVFGSAVGPLGYAAYVTELIGTFFLVFTVGASVRIGSPLAPLAIGAILMVMIYA